MKAVEYEVTPRVGAGPVRLGMTRAECRAVMPEAPNEFRKLADDPVTTDAFHRNAFQVFYDSAERVEYIELSKDSGIKPVFDGLAVLDVPVDVAVGHVERVASFDAEHVEHPYSFVFRELDLALWRPTLPSTESDPEGRTFGTVGVGASGYFAAE